MLRSDGFVISCTSGFAMGAIGGLEESLTAEEAKKEREADRQRVEQERRKLESEAKKEQGRKHGL